MGYRSLAECVRDLEATAAARRHRPRGRPFLEVAAIQRRVYQAAGPALLFRNAKGTAFPILGNLFGTLDRTKYLFRDALESVRLLVELKVDPGRLAKNPWRYRRLAGHALAIVAPAELGPDRSWQIRSRSTGFPRSSAGRWTAARSSPCRWSTPRIPNRPGPARSNLGMYRVQLAGNEYEPNREAGLHYQIHRGIGVHHAAAIARGEAAPGQRLRRRPAGADGRRGHAASRRASRARVRRRLGGRRIAMVAPDDGLPMPAEADFVIQGTIDPQRAQARGALRRPPRLLQPQARFPRLERRSRVPPRQRHLAVHLGGPAASGRHQLRCLHPRADRPGHPQRGRRRRFRPRRRCRRSSPPAPGHRPRAVRALCRRYAGRRRS